MKEVKNNISNFMETTVYEAHGYRVKIHRMNEEGLKDVIYITAIDPDRPDITYTPGCITISFSGTYLLEELGRLKGYLDDVEKLIQEIPNIPNYSTLNLRICD